jgi:RimJ/RimL family protein N-acetyltransferase
MYREIETDRLFIRPITIADADFIFNLVNTDGWIQNIGDRNVKNIIDAQNYIQKILDNEKYFYSIFELKEIKQAIGIISFLYRSNHLFPDIGFAMLPEFGNNGYAFEAAKKYIDTILIEKQIDKIIAITLPANLKSIRLIKRLGLEYENEFIEDSKKLHLYSLHRKNYKRT